MIGSVAEEPMVCMTLRWREVDSKLRFPRSAGPSTKPEQFQGDRQSPKTQNGSHSRAEPEVRIHSAPADSLSLSGFRVISLKSPRFPPFWRPCGAAASAETRKARQHHAEEGECLCRTIFQYRSAAGCGSRYRRCWLQAKSVASPAAISVGLGVRIRSGKAEQGPLILPSQWQT